MTEKLDPKRLEVLLARADDEWFRTNGRTAPKYRDHLAFTADFIAKRYHDKRIKTDNGRECSDHRKIREPRPRLPGMGH